MPSPNILIWDQLRSPVRLQTQTHLNFPVLEPGHHQAHRRLRINRPSPPYLPLKRLSEARVAWAGTAARLQAAQHGRRLAATWQCFRTPTTLKTARGS